MATTTSILEVQQRLQQLGFEPGAVDGIWGRRTISALRSFQKSKGLTADGILGPLSHAALFATPIEGPKAAAGEIPWMAEATRLIRTKEFLGARNNPVILDWAHKLDVFYPGDDIPWCGLFVGHCIATVLPSETLPTALLRAQAWRTAGKPTTPRYGAIMVFWRLGKNSGKGHVGFYAGEDDGAYRILGGNQSNSVGYAWVSADRFLEARWPDSAWALNSFASALDINRAEDLATAEA